MHKHLKTFYSEGYNKSLSKSLDSDRSTAPQPLKIRKLEAIRQTSLDEYTSMKQTMGHEEFKRI